MNLSHAKNLETLRGECDKLGARIARLAFIRATLFVLFVFSLASAFQTIKSRDASSIVDRIKELRAITKETPELGAFLGAIYFPTAGGLQPERSETNSALANASDVEAKSPEQKEAATEAAKLEAKQMQALLGAELTKIANEAFTFAFKAPLLGTEVKLDLRVWGFILLFCFIFWEVHLFVLRHKLRILQHIAGVIAARTPQDATVLDHLLFRPTGRLAAFSRHPAQFEFVTSLIGGAGLIIYLCVQGYDFWEGADPRSRRQLIELYGFVIVYAVAYGGYVRRQINSEAVGIDGVVPVISYPARLLAFAGSRLREFARRVWPEVNLVTGSAMVIGTLWLLVGAPTCSLPRTGWNYLQNPDGWLVGPTAGMGAQADWHNILIATLYGIGLAIAGFSLVLLLVSLARRKRFGAGGISLWLATATTILALFFLTELNFGTFFDLLPYSLPSVLVWLVPLWTWRRHARSRQGTRRADWPGMRRWMVRWFAPQVAVATIVSMGTLFEKRPLVGVPVFVCGLAALALGYWNARALAGAMDAMPETAALPQAQARATPEVDSLG